MTLAQKLENVLKELDAEDARAYGMNVRKNTHMIGAVTERWFKMYIDESIDQAISDAVSDGVVVSDNRRTYLALKDD